MGRQWCRRSEQAQGSHSRTLAPKVAGPTRRQGAAGVGGRVENRRAEPQVEVAYQGKGKVTATVPEWK